MQSNKPPQGKPSPKAPGAPPVYRPQSIQPKMAAPPVYRPQAQPVRAVQRYVAKGNVVYYPDTTNFSVSQDKDTFERSLAVLGGTPGVARTAKKSSWPEFAQNQAGYSLSAMGRPTGGVNQKRLKKQFEDKTKVYAYNSTDNLQTATPSQHLLLTFEDMAEKNTDELPASVTDKKLNAAKCVIEILSDFGVAVPTGPGTTVKDWHDYSRQQELDYRQDNNYIVMYVKQLRYPLIHSRLTKWDEWNPADGRYLVTSTTSDSEGAVGHMIGVTVAGGNKTITDRQQLSPGTGNNPANFSNFKIRYVFRVR